MGYEGMRNGTNHIAFDPKLTPAEKVVIAVFHQSRLDIVGKVRKHRSGAELFLRGCGFEVEKVKESK